MGIGRATLYRMLPELGIETKGAREEAERVRRKEVIKGADDDERPAKRFTKPRFSSRRVS